ncbi:lambda exonuclease family protein [Pseudarthrobacter phenanthrenivorans]|uniref:lambda exonuclease family protein n=1 Tax=Pseudarthrobacter phenanthrenivorans TaxID=361575 RepID=UPI00344B0CEB
MTLHVYENLEQGTDAWLQARCGIVTASVVGQLITAKTVKPAANDYSRALTAALVAERITGHVEPAAWSKDMERGELAEPYARDAYAEHKGVTVDQVGFMVRTHPLFGYKLGYSPDGLVGDDGLLEIKSPRQKAHLSTILADEVPLHYMAQCQTGLLVSGREWLDFISYNAGMPLFIKRVTPDKRWQEAITEAVANFEANAAQMIAAYNKAAIRYPDTERIDFYAEMELL